MNSKLFFTLVLAVVPAAMGCSAAPDAETADETESSADELKTSPKTAILHAVEIFDGPKATLTRNVTKRLPGGALKAALESALVDAQAKATGESDPRYLDSGVWAVYSSKSRKTVVGYAAWALLDDGSAITAAFIGLDLTGKRVVTKEDWSQNDGD